MSRLGLGLGLNLPIPVFLRGDGQPQFPSNFILRADAYDASNFSLVTGNNISQWDDLSGSANNLTQPTSLNQPLFIEQDIVTQYTASNQPTVIDVGGGVTALGFASDSTLGGLSPQTGDFTYEIDFDRVAGQFQTLLWEGSVNSYVQVDNGGKILIVDESLISYELAPFGHINISGRYKVKITREGSDTRAYVDGVLSPTGDVNTGVSEFLFRYIGRGDITSINSNTYSFKQWNSADDSGAPNLTLDFSDTSKMRTSANEVPLLGEDVAKVYADEHNPRYNVVRGDATNDFMLGIPPQAGDFALVFKKKVNTLGTVKTLYSSSTTSAEVRINVSNQIEVVSDTGTVFTYSASSVISEQQVNILQLNGTNLELYETQVVNESKDVTGETFTIDWLSLTSTASNSDWQELGLRDSYLTQEEIDYFYYLRDQETGDILLPPLLPE